MINDVMKENENFDDIIKKIIKHLCEFKTGGSMQRVHHLGATNGDDADTTTIFNLTKRIITHD